MAGESATQPGVQDDDNTPKERQKSPRELAMEQISSQRLESFEKETGVQLTRSDGNGDQITDPDKDPADAEAEAERQRLAAEDGKPPVTTTPAATPAATTPPADDILQKKVKIKVDGVEGEATVEEMQREYQKGRTADRRLAEINRREQEIAARESAQLAAQTAPVKKDDEPAIVLDPELTKKFTSAMFAGDEEGAAAAFQTAVAGAVKTANVGRTEATPVDIDQITKTVEQRFAINSALKKSRDDYPDLYADPDVEALGAMKITAKQKEGLSFTDALELTGKELAEKFGWKKAGHQEPVASPTTREAKLAKKAALDPVESANVRASQTEEIPMTNSQIIAKMAASRPGNSA